jgi:Toprim domain
MSVVSDLARRLARDAEGVCRHYLPAGSRNGRYWLVGDVDNSNGRSLFVRLDGPESGRGAAGRWRDAATGQRGDLLDLIAARERLSSLAETLIEARRYLRLPQPEPRTPHIPVSQGSPAAARRLFASAKPLGGTVGEAYLRARGILNLPDLDAVRFHPRCFYRGDLDDPRDILRDAWPALIAAATDANGRLTGVHRTWLDPSGTDKAPVSTPRRSLGAINGNGIRIGRADDVCAAGEGLETMLSIRDVIRRLPVIAAGSATHLEVLELPLTLRRLYIAEDADPAGHRATATLIERAEALAIDAWRLSPVGRDFNDDLRVCGPEALCSALRAQLAPQDVARFLPVPA